MQLSRQIRLRGRGKACTVPQPLSTVQLSEQRLTYFARPFIIREERRWAQDYTARLCCLTRAVVRIPPSRSRAHAPMPPHRAHHSSSLYHAEKAPPKHTFFNKTHSPTSP